jgi:hypothetical protein
MFAAALGTASEAGCECRSAGAAGATALGYRSGRPDAEGQTNVAGSEPRSEIVKGAFHRGTVSQLDFCIAEAGQGAHRRALPRTPIPAPARIIPRKGGPKASLDLCLLSGSCLDWKMLYASRIAVKSRSSNQIATKGAIAPPTP